MLHYKDKNLTVFKSVLYQTTTAVIESEEALIMTDPTWLPEEIDMIKGFIDERLNDRKLYIIYTHSDFDHVIGAGAFPEAFVIATERFQMNKNKEAVIDEMKAFDQQYYLSRSYEHTYPTVDRLIKIDGDKLKLGSLTLHFFLAPGHTKDGLFTVIEPAGILLSGDYLSDVEIPFITSSYKDYCQTIDKAEQLIKDFDVKCHVPGHGSVTNSKYEINKRLTATRYYLEQLKDEGSDKELIEYCRKHYAFFDGMTDSHDANIKKVSQYRY
ncbi:MBL fold metallo-hydrolase [Alkalibacterium sp.]|nr:MAG: MBL fold metallo-hydrolase [Alkalibacterium sp.]